MTTSWTQNSARQPKAAMIGDPSETPTTGPPAPTRLHQPMAFTRSSREKTMLIKAPEAVPVAAPSMPSSVRAKINISTLWLSAVSRADAMAPTRPTR